MHVRSTGMLISSAGTRSWVQGGGNVDSVQPLPADVYEHARAKAARQSERKDGKRLEACM